MSNAIVEIFTEEIPATLQKQIAQNYHSFVVKKLKDSGILLTELDIFIGITLNRLVVKMKNIDITDIQIGDFISTTLKEKLFGE